MMTLLLIANLAVLFAAHVQMGPVQKMLDSMLSVRTARRAAAARRLIIVAVITTCLAAVWGHASC